MPPRRRVSRQRCLEFCVPVAAAATSLACLLLRRAPGDLRRLVDVVLCAAGFTAAIAMARDSAFMGGAIGLILGVGLTLDRGRRSSP